MRILVWLLPLCAALTACNMAISDHPMLAGQPKSALELKDGLWTLDDPDCKFDHRRPVHRWPKCAGWMILKDGRIVGGKDAKRGEVPVELLIADGTPPILEFPLKDEGKKVAEGYAYIAIEPTANDAGRVTTMNFWIVGCGTEKVPGSTSEIDPYPGIDKDCHPLSIDALRAAATLSRPSPEKLGRIRWIRARAN